METWKVREREEKREIEGEVRRENGNMESEGERKKERKGESSKQTHATKMIYKCQRNFKRVLTKIRWHILDLGPMIEINLQNYYENYSSFCFAMNQA